MLGQPAILPIAAWLLLGGAAAVAQPPAIGQNGVMNAASLTPPALPGGALARGARFYIDGVRLGGRVLLTQGSLTAEARIIAAGSSRIEAVVPTDAPLGNADLVPSTVLGAAEGLGTNNMEEIELKGAPLDKVKRRFRRQSTVLQGPFPNVNVVMGSTCEAGCKAIVRMQLDQAKENGTLAKLKRPLYVFTGLQFEQKNFENLDADVVVVGDCAKDMLKQFPNAEYWGETAEHPNCTPIWANIPERSISTYIKRLTEISK